MNGKSADSLDSQEEDLVIDSNELYQADKEEPNDDNSLSDGEEAHLSKSNEVVNEDDEDDENDADYGTDDDDDEMDYEFVDQMLEEKFVKDDQQCETTVQPGTKRRREDDPNENEQQEKKRIVLIQHGQDHFEVLPEGWVEITHFSGMPVYLHKQSRVCTLARPYTLGGGSARKHSCPISAIPCLQYRKELEKHKQKENEEGEPSGPVAKVETLKETLKEKSLDPQAFHEYCENLFQFKQVIIRKFKSWAERRKHAQIKKRPTLPESTKLITLDKNPPGTSGGKAGNKKFIMNPDGKSVVCILHEYVQHAERTQPKYLFQELENVSKPYCATVMIGDKQYGKGFGSSKKEAKNEAAKATLDILIPDLGKQEDDNPKKKTNPLDNLSFFDDIKIEDSRVSELCMKAGQLSPYQILVECVRRNYGLDQLNITSDIEMLKHQRNKFTLSLGQHKASVICKNKREGKQRAAQAILQLIHPELKSWGAILKLYGRGSFKTPKEKKEESLEVTELQNKASTNKPNYAILEKLKAEMLKLSEEPPALLPLNCSINL